MIASAEGARTATIIAAPSEFLIAQSSHMTAEFAAFWGGSVGA